MTPNQSILRRPALKAPVMASAVIPMIYKTLSSMHHLIQQQRIYTLPT
ncbi:Uncharacterised protein [Vibrio cholerae]|nr:Uncharacterised protein [Vibrio cholerae]